MMLPGSRPQMSLKDLKRKIERAGVDISRWPLLVVGIRGYYKNTMGAPGQNDRRIYDDAIFIVSGNTFTSFNANVDPNGYGFHKGKYLANLTPGFWPVYKFDLHNGRYMALCQRAGSVTVLRDNGILDTGMFGINIHEGGNNTTSSAGCQTIPKTQWRAFISLAESEARRIYGATWKSQVYPYLLLDTD